MTPPLPTVPAGLPQDGQRGVQDPPGGVDQYRKRAPGKAAKLLGLLSDGAWHSNLELSQRVCLRFGARIEELRKGKHGEPVTIEKRCRSGEIGIWEYRLVPSRPVVTDGGGQVVMFP